MSLSKSPEIISYNLVQWSSLARIDYDFASDLLADYNLSNNKYFVFELETLKEKSDGNKNILDFLNQCDSTKKILLRVYW